MKIITYCIPSKNNLQYLKSSIASIRKNSKVEYEVIVFVDSDNDGTELWLIDNKIPYLKNDRESPRGIAYAYNRCIEAATTEIVCMFHADMYMAKGFDTNALKHLKHRVVVSTTRIEPPLHPQGKEKIVQNFGMYPEDFNEQAFDSFVEQQKQYDLDKVTYGIFAPWICYKSELMEIGLHDELFHSYHEDSDIFNRMLLNGMQCVQSRDSLVYHFTCRGGQFQDGIDKITSDEKFHTMKINCQRNYLRKWGSWIKNDEYQHPIIHNRHNVAYIVRNCNLELLEYFEPWCDRIYIEDDIQILYSQYVEKEQKNTVYDLSKRVLNLKNNDALGENDVVVEFDGKLMNEARFNILTQMPELIKQVEESGVYEWDIFTIHVNSYKPQEINLPFLIGSK